MRILVSNDDGIQAKGLWVLANQLQEVADVLVVAPDREQSAIGTSITLHSPLRIKKFTPCSVEGIEAYQVEGTPADNVIIGLQVIAKGDIDLVVTGINDGLNMGNDVFISGTVGAALQGSFYDIPAIAFSTEFLGPDEEPLFDSTAVVARLLAQKVYREGVLYPRTLLNVNVPSKRLSDIRGVALTRLGKRFYRDQINSGNDGKRDYYWIVRGKPEWKDEEGTDWHAFKQGMISVTPIRGNLSKPDEQHHLEKLCAELQEDLFSITHSENPAHT